MPYRFPKFSIMLTIYFLLLFALISRSAATEDGLVIKIGMEKNSSDNKKVSKVFTNILECFV